MFEFKWDSLVTDGLLTRLQEITGIDRPLDESRKVLACVLASVGGMPYTKIEHEDAEKIRIAESILHEAVKHTLTRICIRPSRDGFYFSEPQSDAFEQEITFAKKIDLNRATPEELDALPSIGSVRAQLICDERLEGGPFKTLEEFDDRVRGIGEAVVEDIQHAVTIGAPNELLQEPVSLCDDFKSNMNRLIAIQPGETPIERFRMALDMIAMYCAGDPHPATCSHAVRDFPISPLELDEKSEWTGVLWGSDYYKILADQLKAARESILVCMFHIAFPDDSHPTYKLLQSLVDAQQDGLSVRVLVDNDRQTDPYHSTAINTNARDFLNQNGVPCRFDQADKLLHSKFIVIDNETLIMGSHNWSAGSYFHFDDLSLIVRSQTLSQELTQRFEALWDDSIQ